MTKSLRKIYRFATSSEGSIKSRVLRSGLWVTLGESSVAVLSFVKSVILARLLAPEMFGLIGLCNIVIRALETFTRPGVGQALIQRSDAFENARDTAFVLLLARGFILALLLVILAPVTAAFYEEQGLEKMLMALSIVFVLGGLRNINTIADQKELNFRRLTYLQQVTAFLGTLVTVAAAFWLRSAWALVVGQISTTLFQTALSYYFIPGRPRMGFDWKIAKEILSYGKFITASSAVVFVTMSLDTAIIGKILGTQELGYYVLAFSFANLVTSSLSKVVSGIMLPAYSKLQDDVPALRRAYLRTLSMILLVCLPATIGVVVTAESIIHVVYGSKWEAAVLPLQILVVFGLFRALAGINGYLFEGIGKPDIPLYVSLVRLAILIPIMFPLIGTFGLAGAAIAVTITMALQWLIVLVLTRKYVHVSLVETLGVVFPPLWKSLVMGMAVFVAGTYLDKMSATGLIIAVATGGLTYALLNTRELVKVKNHGL